MDRKHVSFENETVHQQSASAISQKWEAENRKDPEEEYFRLVSMLLA